MEPQNVPPFFDPMQNLQDYFWYTTAAPLNLAVAAQASQTIQIDANSDFLWIATSYQFSLNAALLTEATNVIPLLTLQIVDTGSGKYLMNSPLPLPTIAGDGKRPYRLIGPRVFAANSTIQLNWANYAVAASPNYYGWIVLHGIKQYRRG